MNCVKSWLKLTSYKFIIDIVKYGLKLNLEDQKPYKWPSKYPRSKSEINVIDGEIDRLLNKGVISVSPVEKFFLKPLYQT